VTPPLTISEATWVLSKLAYLMLCLKGAQTRSCSVSVLMEDTAEQVASMHSALVLLANDRRPAGLIWRL